MNVSVSTVEFNSQCVLTNHARSAACIMATEVLVLSRSLLPCLHFNSFNHISFPFPAWTLTIPLSRSENLSSHTYLVKGTWSYVKIVFWWLIITTVPCHTVMFTGLSRSLHGAIIFHRSGYRGVLSVLPLYIRGSRTVSDPRPRPRGQSRCVLCSVFWLDGLPLPGSGSAVQRAMKEWDA